MCLNWSVVTRAHVPRQEPEPEPEPEPDEEEAEEAVGLQGRPLVAITEAEFQLWLVGQLDRHAPGWSPPAPPPPPDTTEMPWGRWQRAKGGQQDVPYGAPQAGGVKGALTP
jgi:hypothetical protein